MSQEHSGSSFAIPPRKTPCPCGSGKKYKNCHQQIDAAARAAALRAEQQPITQAYKPVTFNLPVAGLPTSVLYSAIEPVRNEGRTIVGFVPQGSTGLYSADAALQRLNQSPLQDGQTVAAALIEGNSYLALGEPAVKDSKVRALKFQRVLPDGTSIFVSFWVNNEGFLARIHVEDFTASSFNEAEIKARQIIGPILSNLSLKYDVPVKVIQLDVTEKSTGTLRTAIRIGPRFAIPREREIVLGPMLRGLSSLYREGMNSTSPTYAFLCFYKIIESIKKRREHIARLCVALSEAPIKYDAIRIPDSEPELAALGQSAFPKGYPWEPLTVSQVFRAETRGKKLFAIFDRFLRPLRHRIAHAFLDTGEFADLDDPALLRDVEEWLPFLRFAARITALTDMKVDLPASVRAEFEKRLTAKAR